MIIVWFYCNDKNFDKRYRQIVQIKYIFIAYEIFNKKICLALQLYLATKVKFKPENGDVETVVDQAIKNVTANKVWLTPLKKSPIIAIVIIGWIPINARIIKISNSIEAIFQSNISKGRDKFKPIKIELIDIPNIPATKNKDNSDFILGSSSVIWYFNTLKELNRLFLKSKIKNVIKKE